LVGGAVLLALVGVVSVALIRSAAAAQSGQRGMLGAFAGLLGAGLIAVSLDWTWQMAAAAAPLLIALAVVCSDALRPDAAGEELLAAPETGPAVDGPTSAPVAVRALGLAGAVVALVAVWAGSILALSAVQLDRSDSELQRGDLAAAAESARAAGRLQPWSPEPSLRLATIEQAATNLEAARRRAEEAAQLAPDDFRPWLLLAAIHADLGNLLPATAYGERAGLTGGTVLDQAEDGVP
jgi:tetratricopeptide (TPR) repeat protein